MGLSQLEKAVIEKARSVGNSDLAVPLDDPSCSYLCAIIAKDLGLEKEIDNLPNEIIGFYSGVPCENQKIEIPFEPTIEKLVSLKKDAITYFSCLASIHKGRLKYKNILKNQPFSNAEQIGSRSLLQFGSFKAKNLAHFLVWRKWFYDIDNRAAQETGYIFEPIIAHAIGGTPVSATKSPVRRHGNNKKGRQIDCLKKKLAYEIKMRVTIAASGQGRWKEELDFPKDCKESGYKPVLIVFDSTENPKLTELCKVFKEFGGEVHVGEDAWAHLEREAGQVMSVFIEMYVRNPIQSILEYIENDDLNPLTLTRKTSSINISIGDETLEIHRTDGIDDSKPDLPADVDDSTPGVS